jgi:CRP-like cAMP-binding protein
MKKHPKTNLEFIKKISIFNNICNENIDDILALSTIFNLKKNKLLFFKDEEVKNFYIILKGSAILLENTADGNQNVIQFLREGEIIGDIFAKNFVFNALSSEDSLIMLIPAKLIRELIKNNQIFCLNLLKEVSSLNRKILNSLSRLKVVDAKQRVAQFILSIAFEGEDKLKNANLEYTKSTIASYLNIKPETFSRILQKFKKDGEIDMNKNLLKLKKEDSLLRYLKQ